MANPIEWFAWIYGKWFIGHPWRGFFTILVLSCTALSLVLGALWLRALDDYAKDHPDPKPQTVTATNAASQSVTVTSTLQGTQSKPTQARKHGVKAIPERRILMDGNIVENQPNKLQVTDPGTTFTNNTVRGMDASVSKGARANNNDFQGRGAPAVRPSQSDGRGADIDAIRKAQTRDQYPGAFPDAQSTPSQSHSPQSPASMKQDCGGGSCAQSSGQTGGITAGQINVGAIPRRISPQDLITLTRFLSSAKAKCRLSITVMSNSNTGAFADDFYKAFKDAGWSMREEGPVSIIGFAAPGTKLANVAITINGVPEGPVQTVDLTESDPLFYVAKVIGALKLSHALARSKDQPDDLIEIGFQGFDD